MLRRFGERSFTGVDPKTKVPACRRDSCTSWQKLRRATLLVQVLVLVFILALTTLFLSGLSALLITLTGLAFLALLSGLITLTRLPALLTVLLAVFLHIVCHNSPPFEVCDLAHLCRLPELSCRDFREGWDEWRECWMRSEQVLQLRNLGNLDRRSRGRKQPF